MTMRIAYTVGGFRKEIPLTERALTIGRSTEADLVIDDEKASRLHCGIRFDNGQYILKDLKSKNGTYLNEERIEESALAPGDRFRIGALEFIVQADQTPGPSTAVKEVQDLMDHGKGYGTILREIVNTVEEPPAGRRPRAKGPRP
jgi:pSer/pThr/pTyr-binding forkhead associated (FHA) protein